MFIQTEQTPNPQTLKFLPGKVVMDDGTAFFQNIGEATDSPFAKRLFDVEGVEGGPAASMRMLIGGAFAGIGAINLYCSFNVEDAAATEAIVMGTAIGLALVFGTIVWAKFRGFLEEIPTPPMVIFPTLIAICLYSAMM